MKKNNTYVRINKITYLQLRKNSNQRAAQHRHQSQTRWKNNILKEIQDDIYKKN